MHGSIGCNLQLTIDNSDERGNLLRALVAIVNFLKTAWFALQRHVDTVLVDRFFAIWAIAIGGCDQFFSPV